MAHDEGNQQWSERAASSARGRQLNPSQPAIACSLFHQVIRPALDGHVVEAQQRIEGDAKVVGKLLQGEPGQQKTAAGWCLGIRRRLVAGMVGRGRGSGLAEGPQTTATAATTTNNDTPSHMQIHIHRRHSAAPPACTQAPAWPGAAPETRPRGCTRDPATARSRAGRTLRHSAPAGRRWSGGRRRRHAGCPRSQQSSRAGRPRRARCGLPGKRPGPPGRAPGALQRAQAGGRGPGQVGGLRSRGLRHQLGSWQQREWAVPSRRCTHHTAEPARSAQQRLAHHTHLSGCSGRSPHGPAAAPRAPGTCGRTGWKGGRAGRREHAAE